MMMSREIFATGISAQPLRQRTTQTITMREVEIEAAIRSIRAPLRVLRAVIITGFLTRASP
jgi:hypothetical protein